MLVEHGIPAGARWLRPPQRLGGVLFDLDDVGEIVTGDCARIVARGILLGSRGIDGQNLQRAFGLAARLVMPDVRPAQADR